MQIIWGSRFVVKLKPLINLEETVEQTGKE
jgi:hypothetical protein